MTGRGWQWDSETECPEEASEQRAAGDERSHGAMERRSIPGRRNGRCKGREVETISKDSRNI